jgi:hypothetical protein
MNEEFFKNEVLPAILKLRTIKVQLIMKIHQSPNEDFKILIYAKMAEKIIKISQNNNQRKQQYLLQLFDDSTIIEVINVTI